MVPACDCDGGCDGGCGAGYGFGDSGCDDECGGGLMSCGSIGQCDLGDPFQLLGGCCDYQAGGWVQMGYHNKNTILFNSRKHEYNLHQAWIYAEKAIDTSDGFDLGGRIDYVYGIDAQDTQAFGIANGHWDNQWDHGAYGHALPQLYGEAGYGDFSIKFGHFYTLIGYEVVTAPDNFFYSHAYTMYNSEPFTHSGAIATYAMTDDISLFGGYVLGWDSGFEDNGDAFLGGGSVQLTDDINVTSTVVGGRFADNFGGDERGIMSSTVANIQLTEDLSYIFQADILDSEDHNGATVRETYGINQYLIKQVSDCLGFGARFEWWNVNADSVGLYGDNATAGANLPGDFDIYALTLGMNVKPHANLMFRPEIRWDWAQGSEANYAAADFQVLEDGAERQTTFGIDTIILF
nr:porin [Rubripirellula amarantea]